MKVKQFRKRTICITVRAKRDNPEVYCSCFKGVRFFPLALPLCGYIDLVESVVKYFCGRFDSFMQILDHRFIQEWEVTHNDSFHSIHFAPGGAWGRCTAQKSSFIVFSEEEEAFTLVEKLPISSQIGEAETQNSMNSHSIVICQSCSSHERQGHKCRHEKACMDQGSQHVFLEEPAIADFSFLLWKLTVAVPLLDPLQRRIE